MSWYRAGTITLTAGSRTVMGVGTEWVANVLPAAMLLQDGPPLEVERVVSDGELLLKVAYAGAGGAGLAYAIAPTQGHVTEATRLLLQVLETFGDLRQAWLDGSLKGDPGTGLAIRGAVPDVGSLPTNPRLGDAYLIGENVHVWVGSAWFDAGPLRGEPGLTGPANVLTIGTVTTGDTGTPAAASITGTAPAQELHLTLPRGLTGTITPQLQALHDDALQARNDAQAARDTAGGYAGAAAASAGNASASATTAQGHAGAAATSAGAADGSATAAAGSATSAAQSATDAAGQKSAAQTAAAASADSATEAAGHAGDAGDSATAAAASEGAALGHAEAAEGSAADAAALVAQAGIIGIGTNVGGHLIITRADGTTFDAGYVIGPAGPVGASIKVKPSVDTVGDLPALGNEENDARVVRADGHLYVWDGDTWTDGGQFQGPPGTTNYLLLDNLPTLGTAAALDVPASGAATAGQVVKGDDPRLSDSRSPTAHGHAAAQISDSTPTGRALMTAANAATARATIGAGTSSFSGAWADLGGKPPAIAAGETPEAARAAIGAGTSSLTLGLSSAQAKPGNWAPGWSEVTDKPAYATQEEAEAGAATDKLMTPLRTAQAIAVLAGGGKMTPEPRTANTSLTAADKGKIIEASGSWTQTFAANAALGAGWHVYYRSGGDITFDPSGAETIDGLASYISYPGEVRLIYSDGIALRSVVLQGYCKTFTASTDWVKPPGYTWHGTYPIGGGGSGGAYRNTSAGGINGGTGGGGIPVLLPASALADIEPVVVGLGGAAVVRNSTGTTVGNNGGESSFAGIRVGGGLGGTGSTPQAGGWAISSSASPNGYPGAASGSVPALYGGASQGANASSLYGGGAGGVAFTSGLNTVANAGRYSRSQGGAAASATSGSIVGDTGTGPGAGGGGAALLSSSGTATSGPGTDGEVQVWGAL